MARCYYHAVRLQNGLPQILVSATDNRLELSRLNTELLPERRWVLDTLLPDLEWDVPPAQVSQAAIALLGHATTAPALTRRYALRFQTLFLDCLPRQGWTCRADQVRSWVAQQERIDRAMQRITVEYK